MNTVQLQFYLSIIETPAERDIFDEIYHTYRHTMHHVAMGILHDYHLAEDATQGRYFSIMYLYAQNGLLSRHYECGCDWSSPKIAHRNRVSFLDIKRSWKRLVAQAGGNLTSCAA